MSLASFWRRYWYDDRDGEVHLYVYIDVPAVAFNRVSKALEKITLTTKEGIACKTPEFMGVKLECVRSWHVVNKYGHPLRYNVPTCKRCRLDFKQLERMRR